MRPDEIPPANSEHELQVLKYARSDSKSRAQSLVLRVFLEGACAVGAVLSAARAYSFWEMCRRTRGIADTRVNTAAFAIAIAAFSLGLLALMLTRRLHYTLIAVCLAVGVAAVIVGLKPVVWE